MTDATATMRVRDVEDGVAVIHVTGEFVPATEETLMRAYLQAERARSIILDFTDLTYMNSGGIGLLVTLLVRAQRNDQRLLAYGLSEHYRHIFNLTRLDDVIGLHDSQEAALAAS
jgi:anti-sigma B factor antagonist